MNNACFAIVRAIHFGSCLLVASFWIFDCLIAAPVVQSRRALELQWNRTKHRLIWAALTLALLSGILWLLLVTAGIADVPFWDALDSEALPKVWRETLFGAVWKLRLICWLAVIAIASGLSLHRKPGPVSSIATWAALLASETLVGSLAWAGHGLIGSPLHHVADVVHLAIAACWPGGLAPLLIMLWLLRRAEPAERRACAWPLIRRFSNLSVVSVILLGGSGLINEGSLVGPVPNLWTTLYGRILLAKILLFLIAVTIGAVNLFILRPRLAPPLALDPNTPQSTLRTLRRNIAAELLIATTILLLVGLLGLLPPLVH